MGLKVNYFDNDKIESLIADYLVTKSLVSENKIVESLYILASHVAQTFFTRCPNRDDMIQSAVWGAWQALPRFSPERSKVFNFLTQVMRYKMIDFGKMNKPQTQTEPETETGFTDITDIIIEARAKVNTCNPTKCRKYNLLIDKIEEYFFEFNSFSRKDFTFWIIGQGQEDFSFQFIKIFFGSCVKNRI